MNNALNNIRQHSAGFTLVEVMIVVSLIALLAAFGIPNYQRARKRGQATSILNDLRLIDDALSRWALENNKSGSDLATINDIKPYLKVGCQLYVTGADLLGSPYGPTFLVDAGPQIPPASFAALSDVAPADFWSPYK
jgi:prepilin-type N-terminal cleavage/methylation domain-containing protein